MLLAILSFALAGDPVCGMRLQIRCEPAAAWTDYALFDGVCPLVENVAYGIWEEHKGRSSCPDPSHLVFDPGDVAREAERQIGQWRVADADGRTVVAFQGPWAVDLAPLATAMGASAEAVACDAATRENCWSALEVWMELRDYQVDHCGRAANPWRSPPMPEPALPAPEPKGTLAWPSPAAAEGGDLTEEPFGRTNE